MKPLEIFPLSEYLNDGGLFPQFWLQVIVEQSR